MPAVYGDTLHDEVYIIQHNSYFCKFYLYLTGISIFTLFAASSEEIRFVPGSFLSVLSLVTSMMSDPCIYLLDETRSIFFTE